jgi:hypothetical protein
MPRLLTKILRTFALAAAFCGILQAQAPVVTLTGAAPQQGGTATFHIVTPQGRPASAVVEVGGAVLDPAKYTLTRFAEGGYCLLIQIPEGSAGETLEVTVLSGGQHSVTSTTIAP